MLVEAVAAGAAAWCSVIGACAVSQRRLIFKAPTKVRRLPSGPWAGTYTVIRRGLVRTDGVELEGWLSQPKDGIDCEGVVIYFGGRSENVAWAADMSSMCAGWSVAAFNHRGFGGSTGVTTERTLMADARAVLKWVRDEVVCDRRMPLVLVGRSLGSVAAVRVAAEFEVDGLVLLSPLDSLQSVLRKSRLLGPASFLLRYPMDAITFAPAVRCPSLTLMCEGDAAVSNGNSLRLWDALGGKKRIERLQGESHCTFPREFEVQRLVGDFLRERAVSMNRVSAQVGS